jgi:Protein of unknown function (DUF3285)
MVSPMGQSPQPESGANDVGDAANVPSTPPPSYVKLAMRNMVRKRGTSLFHFALTTVGLLTLLVGLAYLTH